MKAKLMISFICECGASDLKNKIILDNTLIHCKCGRTYRVGFEEQKNTTRKPVIEF